jgi:hypothetical protein
MQTQQHVLAFGCSTTLGTQKPSVLAGLLLHCSKADPVATAAPKQSSRQGPCDEAGGICSPCHNRGNHLSTKLGQHVHPGGTARTLTVIPLSRSTCSRSRYCARAPAGTAPVCCIRRSVTTASIVAPPCKVGQCRAGGWPARSVMCMSNLLLQTHVSVSCDALPFVRHADNHMHQQASRSNLLGCRAAPLVAHLPAWTFHGRCGR